MSAQVGQPGAGSSVQRSARARASGARVRAAFALRRATAMCRPLPDFLILGAQKAGTTSLWAYLAEHPALRPAMRKEVHFFDRHFDRGVHWYRAFFPLRSSSAGRPLTYEASPEYLWHPDAPGRAAQILPDARFVVLLREPVSRAWSQYKMNVGKGREPCTFAEALAREPERLGGDSQQAARGSAGGAVAQRFGYALKGQYADQLERWFAPFPRERFLVLRAEELFSDPRAAYAKVLEFLDLSLPDRLPEFRVLHKGAPEGLDERTEREAREFFVASNRRLAELVGISFDELGA